MEKRKVEFELLESMLGTVPKNKQLYQDWIASKAENGVEDEVATVVDGEKGLTGFHQDDVGIYVMDYFIKGFFKSTANAYKEILKVKNMASKMTNFMFIFPRMICIGDKPDGILERPLRAQTAQGPRVTLASSEYVDAGTRFSFFIGLIPHKEITWDRIEAIMDFGAEGIGLGQWRNASHGRFKWSWS